MATAAAGEVGGQHRYGRRTMPSLQGGGQVRSRRALGAARAWQDSHPRCTDVAIHRLLHRPC